MFGGEILRQGKREKVKQVFEELVQKDRDPILDGCMLQSFAVVGGSPLMIIIIMVMLSEKLKLPEHESVVAC